MQVAGSVAVITGAAQGIGLALARSLAAAGARVVLGDVQGERVHEAARGIRVAGGQAESVQVDVTRDEQVAALMDAAVRAFGAIHVVCANAGLARDGLMVGRDPATGRIDGVLDSQAFRDVIEVNLVGAFITLREAARRMAENRWKGVLIVTSSVNRIGVPGQISYSSAKAAVALWPKILAGEFQWSGLKDIRVVGLAPGYTGTEALRALDPSVLGAVLRDVHLGRLLEPEELAATVKHVIENEAIDGTTIEVTGGATFGPWQRAK